MENTSVFQVSDSNGLVGGQHETLRDAVLEAASHDGWCAMFTLAGLVLVAGWLAVVLAFSLG